MMSEGKIRRRRTSASATCVRPRVHREAGRNTRLVHPRHGQDAHGTFGAVLRFEFCVVR